MTVLLAFLTYMDRVCISVTAPSIMHDLQMTPLQMGIVFSSFTATYALFEIPTGWWADRNGSRYVLTRIVIWWSAFTGLTAGSWNFVSLAIVRALFGIGEAGAWPTVTGTLARWFPQEERGTAQGVFFMGAHLGGGLTPILVAIIASVIGWRATFPILSVAGFLWAGLWFFWYRDEPHQHPRITAQELDWIEARRRLLPQRSFEGPILQRLLSTPSLWLLCAMYFTQSYGFNLYVTWLPMYLMHEKRLQGGALSILSGLPLLLSVPADLAGGLTTDRLGRCLGLRRGRSLVGFLSLALAAIFLLNGALIRGWTAPVLIGLAAASSNFLLGASWGTCVDIGGKHAGTLSAAMNTSGQIGGILSPIIFPILTRNGSDWSVPLYLTAFLYFVGAVCWCFIHAERPLGYHPHESQRMA
jgi:MFS transporter, ACS family, glucarate transporter